MTNQDNYEQVRTSTRDTRHQWLLEMRNMGGDAHRPNIILRDIFETNDDDQAFTSVERRQNKNQRRPGLKYRINDPIASNECGRRYGPMYASDDESDDSDDDGETESDNDDVISIDNKTKLRADDKVSNDVAAPDDNTPTQKEIVVGVEYGDAVIDQNVGTDFSEISLIDTFSDISIRTTTRHTRSFKRRITSFFGRFFSCPGPRVMD